MARQNHLLPVAGPTGGKLRVVFVNPLDSDAADAVEEVTGLLIQRQVGTLTGVRAAIHRIYAGRTTRVVRASSEMAPEITRRVQAPGSDAKGEGVSKDTAPLHRLEQEATIEQRHEALLLALIERGAIGRVDYHDALKRLLSGRGED